MIDWDVDWDVDRIEDPESQKLEEQQNKHNEAMQKHVHTITDMMSAAKEILKEAKQAAKDAQAAAKRSEKMAGDTQQTLREFTEKSKESLDGHGKAVTAETGEARKVAEASAKSAASTEKMVDKISNSVAALGAHVEDVSVKAEAKMAVLEERLKAHEDMIKHLSSVPRESGTTVVQSDDGGKYGDLAKEIGAAIAAALSRPRKIIRDRNGYAMGIE